MSEILQDVSTPALVTAIEANLFEFVPLFRQWRQAEVHDDPDLLWLITDIPYPVFNSVLHAQLTLDSVDAAIEAAIARCTSRNVPMLWWTGPATRPADLSTHLHAHGFVHDGDAIGMAVDLLSLDEHIPILPDLVIEQITEIESLRKWSHTVTTGFGWPDFVGHAFLDFYSGLGFGAHLPLFQYLGRLNGEPVATSTLFLGAGVAGIYDVTTVSKARQKGIGAAMTLKALHEARARGYRVGILQASQMGVSVYRKLGFQEYCKISHYVWADGHTNHGPG